MEDLNSVSRQSAGPMGMAELQGSINTSTKRKKSTRRASNIDNNEASNVATPDAGNSVIDELNLNRLRARLDPMSHGSRDSDLSAVVHSTPSLHEAVHKKKKKRRLKKKSLSEDGGTSPIGMTREQAVHDKDDVVEPVADEVSDTGNEVSTGIDGLLHKSLRQLPEPPVDQDGDELQGQGYFMDRLQPAKQYYDPDDPHLLVAQEDIVEVNQPQDHHHGNPSDADAVVTHYQPSTSQQKDTVFVERKRGRGFYAQKRDGAFNSPSKDGVSILSLTLTSTQLSMYIHAAFIKISTAAHAMLAGMSLWECIVVNLLSEREPAQVALLQFYSSLSLASQFIHTLLLMFAITALCDRLDIVRTNRPCIDSFFKMPQKLTIIIALILLVVGFVLTTSTVAVDERIHLFPNAPNEWLDVLRLNTTSQDTVVTHSVNKTAFYEPSGLSSGSVDTWLAISITRCVCYTISLALSIWLSTYDRLGERLDTLSKLDLRSVNKD